MSASGINWGWKRDMFIRARICPCDPTSGDSCRLCDGTAADESELRGYLPRAWERAMTHWSSAQKPDQGEDPPAQ